MDRWYEAQAIAYNMLEYNTYRGISEGATHYHATYVNPFWADSLQMVGRIGAHIFYRWE
jgi:spore germination cell wall hydrolase CwlJ-like protein